MSTSKKWKAAIDRRMSPTDGLPAVLKMDPMKDWEKNTMPGMSAETDMGDAFIISCAYPEHPMVRQFLERALLVAERGIAEKIPTEPEKREQFAMEWAQLFRCKNYCRAMLYGEPMNRAELTQAADELLRDSEQAEGGWGADSQPDYMQAVTLLLVAGDVDRARELLKVRRSFKWVKPWHEGLRAVALTVGSALEPLPADAPQFLAFDGFFQAIREPDWEGFNVAMLSEAVLRFEIALIRFLYVTHPGKPLDWTAVFRGISE